MYFLKYKSNTAEATEQFFSHCVAFVIIKGLISDNGSEFMSKEFKSLLTGHIKPRRHIRLVKMELMKKGGEHYSKYLDVC